MHEWIVEFEEKRKIPIHVVKYQIICLFLRIVAFKS